MQDHDERWIDHFRASGYPEAEPLASGMEGAVYRLGRGLVAKVWAEERPHGDLLALQRFYTELAARSLPFATPELVDVVTVDGRSLTIERELHGRPLQDLLDESSPTVPAPVEACLGTVLESLASAGDLPSARALPALSEARPLRGELDWPDALVSLLERRVQRFGDQLATAVDDFRDVLALVTDAVRAVGHGATTGVIHGDVCGVNVLVDDRLRPTAVLDWGFLSTVGDPAFDAGVTAGIHDMYGHHARELDDHLVDTFSRRLSRPREHLLVYRAAYAVATSNAYDPEGLDGHFAWCVRTLSRPDVRDALLECASTY